MQVCWRAVSVNCVPLAPSRPIVPLAGRWPMLERIPRHRFLRLRRQRRAVSLAGALVIATLAAGFAELHPPVGHVLTAAAVAAWVVGVTWTMKQRWLRWLRDDFAMEVSAKLDGIRRAAPFN
jgi:hypothetical protein